MKEFLKNAFTVSAGVAMFMLIAELGIYVYSLYVGRVGYFWQNIGVMLLDASLFALMVSLIFVMLLSINFAKMKDFLNKPI